MNWTLKKFNELTTYELYDILNLRETVFIVEQNCVYLDCDRMDINCLHLFAYVENKLIAYLRIIPAEHNHANIVSIGRVIVHPSYRGKNIGKILFTEGKKAVKNLYGKNTKIIISAQHHLQNFYQNLGFTPVGEVYDEDGIPHIKMNGLAE